MESEFVVVLGIQVLGVVFGVVLFYYTFINYKKKELSSFEFVFWSLGWIIFIYLVLFPFTLSFVAQSLNLVRVMDFFTIVGFMFLVFLAFYSYMINLHTQKKLERVVRALAMRRKK